MSDQTQTSACALPVPKAGLAGLPENFAADAVSGFLVFLIALPLCLGIAMASGYPPIAGIFTAIIGGLVSPFISNSELTIKGPAAGLIVIAIGAVTELGQLKLGPSGYELALGVGVAAGIVQIIFGILRTGIVGEFFPTSAVHGMLAAIGVIIAGKQIHTVLGVTPAAKEPLHQIAEIPRSFMNLNPEIALIGGLSLLILFVLPLVRNKYIRMIPAPMIVVLVAVPLGIYFDLDHVHYYDLNLHHYRVGPDFLVKLPEHMFDAITRPSFAGLATTTGIKYVIMFALVGTLESLLTAKAIDMLDPWRRKTNYNRDILAIGIGNTLSAYVGGLPMISEVVRSGANINNGARTRFANMYHGLFLLTFVALAPGLIHRIPLAALGAMLVYTGYRLANPREFVHMYHIGKGELVIFVTTIIAVLATDLLIGIGIGIAMTFLLHMLHLLPAGPLFRPHLEIERLDDKTIKISVKHFLIFSSWIPFQRHVASLNHDNDVVIDLSETRFLDHTVMAKLEQLQREFNERDCTLTITGLELHDSLSSHPLAARKKSTP